MPRSTTPVPWTAALLLSALAWPAHAADWNQFRGPAGCGVLPGAVWPAKDWPPDGPALLWESEPFPGAGQGGYGSPVVADGRVYLYVAWKKSKPVAERKVPAKALEGLGACDENVPPELLQKIEAARVGEERKKADRKTLRDWIAKWIAANLDEAQAKACGRFAEDRLNRGDTAAPLDFLRKLRALRDKTFANQEELDKWLADQAIAGAQREALLKVVPTTAEYGEDVIVCLNAADGKTLWKKTYPGQPAGNGASSTPCVSDGELYVAGSAGMAYCLDARNGDEVWKAQLGRGGVNASFTVVDGLAVLTAGGLHAFDAKTGAERWHQKAAGGGHSSPAVWKAKGKSYLICNGRKAACVDPADGKIMWEVEGGGDSTAAACGEFLAVNAGKVLQLYRISPEKAEKLAAPEVGSRGSSPALDGQNVYLISGGKTCCVRAADGSVAWELNTAKEDWASPILAGDRLLTLAGGSVFVIGLAEGQARVLGRKPVGSMTCTSPALSDGKLFVRGPKAVLCYSFAAAKQQ